MDQLHRHLLRLPAGGAVADGDVLHAVFADHPGKDGDGLLFLPLAMGGVHHSCVQHLAGAVHHRHLAAHAVPGVQSHGDLALDRGLHQKRLEVQGKLADGPLVGAVGEGGAGLPLQGGEDQAVIGVLRRGFEKVHGGAAGDHHAAAHGPQGQFPVQFHADLQLFLFLAPVDGQDLMALELGQGLGEVIVEAVDAVLLRGGLGVEHAAFHQQFPELSPEGGVIADGLRHDVAGARQGVLRRLHALFGVYIA